MNLSCVRRNSTYEWAKMQVIGLKSCDTCRNALKFLRQAGFNAQLRDVRTAPLSAREIAELVATFGDALVNRRSTTWRGLGDGDRVMNLAELVEQYPAVMKRPVIVNDGAYYLGWGSETRSALGVPDS
jgi:arsenate reductase-like glutaredoxin family protein